jgi:radical SAM protein with 4Fe4S-binding SPASM domain
MECPHIPEIRYSEFSKRLHDKVVYPRIPIDGSIEVTNRCNLSCVHCYINLHPGDRKARTSELSCQELCKLIDQIVDEGCLWVLFTGGEPLIRGDFLDIYAYAKKKGLLITLFTNGTLITPRIADYLKEWPPFVVEITIYGRSRETYERVTRKSGSYERCMRGIELLVERGVPIKLKSIIMTLNKHEVWDMKAYAEELGVDFRFDSVLNVRLDGDQSPAKYRLSPEDVVALDVADSKRMKGWRDLCSRFLKRPLHPENLYQCGAGENTFHVDHCGRMSVCIMSRFPDYNLRNGSFKEGWHVFMPRVRAQAWSKETPCKKCQLISLCGQCPGWAKLENGDQETSVAYLCRIAHLRAETFGLNNKRQEKNEDEESER